MPTPYEQSLNGNFTYNGVTLGSQGVTGSQANQGSGSGSNGTLATITNGLPGFLGGVAQVISSIKGNTSYTGTTGGYFDPGSPQRSNTLLIVVVVAVLALGAFLAFRKK